MSAAAESVLQLLIAGVLVGCVYGLMCIGLGLIFGIMKIINFAQGEFLMLGMYATLFFVAGFGGNFAGELTPFVVAAGAGPVLFVFGIVAFKLTLSKLDLRTSLNDEGRHGAQLVATLGLALIVQNMALMLFGAEPRSVSSSLSSSAWTVEFWNESIMLFVNKARALAAAISIVVAIAAMMWVSKSRLGKSLRAAANDRLAAMYCGVNIDRVYMLAFGIGAAVTALAGALCATFYSFQPYVGLDFVIIMYAGVVLGGLGSVSGSFIGGVLIGFIQQASTLVLPQQLQNATIFFALLVILILRPQGLFGRQSERV